jgi:hypothetical protein
MMPSAIPSAVARSLAPVVLVALALTTGVAAAASRDMKPISLHPRNPHYFLFRRKPTVLTTSAEHYGAVLNRVFDFIPYLEELREHGFNQSRAFSGVYMEDPASFGIERNTLAPGPGQLIAPWARSEMPGYANGGNKFDLSRWNPAYFQRLKSYLREAGKRGVVIELVLFCPYYEESMWRLSPLHPANNVNGTPDVPRTEVLTLKHPRLLGIQEAMVRKLVMELREFGNLYYEIANEPYFGGVTLEWQRRIAEVIAETERGFPNKHLIAQNIANGSAEVTAPFPQVSVFNFHYANPPTAVAENCALNKPIAFDETGFKGTADLPYRTDAWEFMLAGGAAYSHLDYSFAVGHERGTFPFTKSPGGGGEALRRQLAILKRFIESFDFIRMQPDRGVIKGGVPDGGAAWALVEPGRQYAVYIRGGAAARLTLDIPPGRYRAEWVNPRTGATDKTETLRHAGGELSLESPPYSEDIALRVRRTR